MLTITTTRKIDALRHRATQAETALTDTNRRLEELLEQRRESGQERLDTRNDLAAVRDQLEAAQQLADEAMASEARTKSLCDLMVKDASAELAARDRTIAELRADLEHARKTRSAAEPELPEHTVLQFRTDIGGLVVVIGKPETDYSDAECTWQCLACGADSGFDTDSRVDRMRHLANKHASECRAIPASTGDTADAEKAGARS